MTKRSGNASPSKPAAFALASTGSYAPVFMFAAVAYLLALAVTHAINPQYRAVTL